MVDSSGSERGGWLGRGRGKVILCGEHAVVYGHPALAAAVTLGTEVRLRAETGPTRVLEARADPRLEAALSVLLPAEGLGVEIDSTLPVGRGMGSSAALCVALARAELARQGRRPSPGEVADLALAGDRAFHGNPSGVDTTVSAMGGVLRFQRGAEPRALPGPRGWRLVVLDSGVAGHTGALVAQVAAARPGVDPHLARLGALSDLAAANLDDLGVIGEIFNEAHARLRAVGVSTPALDHLADFARTHGAVGAKLSGAGGGGVVIAAVADSGDLLRAASEAGLTAFACDIAAPEPP